MGIDDMNMRERIARAIEKALQEHGEWPHLVKPSAAVVLADAAAAVLDVMMAPTSGMVEEGAYLTPHSQGGEGPIQPDVTRSIWQAMLTAARNGA